MLRIAICDDTQSFLFETQEIARQWPRRPVGMSIELYTDADALIEAHKADPFDIILLDVVMPLLGGIDAAAEIRKQDKNVKIIFLSVTPEFAVDSYTVKADNGNFGLSNVAATMVNLMGYEAPAKWDESVIELK